MVPIKLIMDILYPAIVTLYITIKTLPDLFKGRLVYVSIILQYNWEIKKNEHAQTDIEFFFKLQ